MIRRPAAPTGRLTESRRHRAGTGHPDLALRRGVQVSTEPARPRRWPAAAAAPVGPARCGGGEVWAEPARPCRWPAAAVALVGPARCGGGEVWAEPARPRRWPAAAAAPVGPARRRDLQDSAEPARTRRQPAASAGRADLPLIPSRHEDTLVELTLAPVADEIPPRWDERRPSGRKAA
ncbi:hypothetical protein [Streptomyces sp. NPDC050416]|uniref:hypothetical protein n=1 Tax=Streptomyces sp. NPDC050416 TaxID=3365611 RepID=UPI00379EACAC